MGFDRIKVIEGVGDSIPWEAGGILQERLRCRPAKPQIATSQLLSAFNDKRFLGREVGGGSCLGTHVRIKDFKI